MLGNYYIASGKKQLLNEYLHNAVYKALKKKVSSQK
jgi:hypothetical protein